VKIDIQGFECQALLGMEKLLHKNKQVKVLFEYIPSGLEAAGYSGSQLLDFLTKHGFVIFTVANDGSLTALQGEPQLNSMGYTNLFARRDNFS
jgi:hypothetical protein